jgi:hypothetical protein
MFRMLTAADFNNDPLPPTFEVDDEGPERRLTTKMVSELAQLAQPHPEFYLLPRHTLAQGARTFVGHRDPTPPSRCARRPPP